MLGQVLLFVIDALHATHSPGDLKNVVGNELYILRVYKIGSQSVAVVMQLLLTSTLGKVRKGKIETSMHFNSDFDS